MPTDNFFKIRTRRKNVFLRVCKGHFATSHSHTNYYIDITTHKTRLSEAKALAQEILPNYHNSTIVDTIICLDGTQVIGTCLADALTKNDFANMNAHQTIYVVTPEQTSNNQLIFRDNIAPMIHGKHVLILAASVVTGNTAKAAIDAIKYYGGYVAGIAAAFATVDKVDEYKVVSAFDPTTLPDYAAYAPGECPMCKQAKKLDALVNSYGYSKL